MDQLWIERLGERASSTRPFCLKQRPANRAETRLLQVVEVTFAVRRDDLRAATRGRCDIALARQAGMYLARVVLGMTLSDAGDLFGRDRTTASHACRLVEDLRDDPKFDALLDAMETIVVHPDARDGRAGR